MLSQGEAYACCNLGVLHYRQQRYEEALTHFERFFEAARLLKDQKVLDVARVNLGTVRAALNFKDYVQVRTHYIVGVNITRLMKVNVQMLTSCHTWCVRAVTQRT